MNITESSSRYDNLEKMTIQDILLNINKEDITVPIAVNKAIPEIKNLVIAIVEKMKNGGRLFYIGAGTSGRLGVIDASECPPTFGIPFETVIGIIAGGDQAIRKAVEFAEDNTEQAWKDLEIYKITSKDFVVGIAASGRTPYVSGGLIKCNENDIITGSISCNPESLISTIAKYPIEVVVGPEFLTGSTRMKAGTAQKLVLNMITTSVMISLGKVKGNKMVDMQLSNKKLIQRGVAMIVDQLGISQTHAQELLVKFGNVRSALENYKT